MTISANHNGPVNLASLSSEYHFVMSLYGYHSYSTNMDTVVKASWDARELHRVRPVHHQQKKRVDKPKQAAANPFGVDVALITLQH